MTKDEAVKSYKELTYKLAKAVDQLSYIKGRMSYINREMEWDGMFELDFDTAMVKLAAVESAAILYTFEDEFRLADLENMKAELDALKRVDGK